MLNKKKKITNLLGEGVISNPVFFSTKLIVGGYRTKRCLLFCGICICMMISADLFYYAELKQAFFVGYHVYVWWQLHILILLKWNCHLSEKRLTIAIILPLFGCKKQARKKSIPHIYFYFYLFAFKQKERVISHPSP